MLSCEAAQAAPWPVCATSMYVRIDGEVVRRGAATGVDDAFGRHRVHPIPLHEAVAALLAKWARPDLGPEAPVVVVTVRRAAHTTADSQRGDRA
eukprot:3692884-Prymnesium_polylepis.1